jgi:hypothetical protein
MSNGSTPLPPLLNPSGVRASIQAVAVRLIHAPSELQNNPAPLRLRGEVKGQTERGSVLVETDRGLVELVLKDKQSLPKGSRIDIDLPAGKSPQHASIRPALSQDAQRQAPPPPTLTEALSQNQPSLERQASLDNRTLDAVIQSRQNSAQDAAAANAANQIAKGDLQLGQFVRLIPIPPGDAELQMLQLARPVPVDVLLGNLVETLQNIPTENAALRNSLVTLLSRIDLPLTLQNSSKPEHLNLIGNIQNILQSIGNLSNIKNTMSQNQAFGAALSAQSFNPTTSIDAQILGLQIPKNGSALSFSPSTSSSSQIHNITIPSLLPSSQGVSSNQQTLFFVAPQTGNQISQPNTHINIAQVIGQTSQNLPILSISVPGAGFSQNYAMQFNAQNLPSSLALSGNMAAEASPSDILSHTQILVSLQPLESQIQTSSLKNPTWQSLQDILFLLSQSPDAGLMEGHVQPHNISGILPSPASPSQFGALALFFLSVFGSGDIENWMPAEALNMLKQTTKGRSLLDTLVSDLTRSGRADGAAVTQDWRGVHIPFLWEQNIYKIPLYYKDMSQEEHHEKEAKKRRLRFLFDLNLTRMGDVQIDGFLQSSRLDLIMRTKTPLSPPMQNRMKQLYAGAVEKSNLTGDLSFQFKPENWVDFLQPLDAIGVEA